MGMEGQFTESFAGWSHEVRRGQALVRADHDSPGLQLPRVSVPNIVKYRLLPTTALVAIALTAPGFSSDAGALLETPDSAPNRATVVAPPLGVTENARPSAFAVEESVAVVGGGETELLVALLIPDPVVKTTAPTALVSVPQPQAIAAPAGETSFAEAFEPFVGSSANTLASTPEIASGISDPVSAALPTLPEATPSKPAIAAVTAITPIDQTPASATRLIPSLDPQINAIELPVLALAQGPILPPSLAINPIEPVSVPLVAIGPIEAVSENLSLTTDDARALALQSNPIEPAVAVTELVPQAAPVRQVLAKAPAAQSPASPAPAPTSSAAMASQLTSLPPGRGGPARNDAMPIVVAEPQAVPAPAAKTSVSSAQPTAFVNVVDPRRPASQPVSGTVSGFDLDIQSRLITRIDGRVAGQLDFQQTSTALAVRLGSIVELLKDRYDMREFARITTSSASDIFVTMAQLRDAGIPITYDPVYDEFNVGSRDHRPTNAHKVQIDQIGSPSRSTTRSAVDQARP